MSIAAVSPVSAVCFRLFDFNTAATRLQLNGSLFFTTKRLIYMFDA